MECEESFGGVCSGGRPVCTPVGEAEGREDMAAADVLPGAELVCDEAEGGGLLPVEPELFGLVFCRCRGDRLGDCK